jgi:hypothetical protein
MGAVESCKGNGTHDVKVAAETVAVVPCFKNADDCDVNGGAGTATGALCSEKDDGSLATASTQSDAGSSTASLPLPSTSASSELDLLKATESRPASAAAAVWRSPNNDALRWVDGASYAGSLSNGKMNGYGKWTSADECTTYAGEWLDDQWHGRGELVSEVGTYDGEFRNGAFHGSGIMRWADQRYYEGEWKRGKRDGYGLNVSKMGQQRAGYWKQNRFVGLEEERGCSAWGSR